MSYINFGLTRELNTKIVDILQTYYKQGKLQQIVADKWYDIESIPELNNILQNLEDINLYENIRIYIEILCNKNYRTIEYNDLIKFIQLQIE